MTLFQDKYVFIMIIMMMMIIIIIIRDVIYSLKTTLVLKQNFGLGRSRVPICFASVSVSRVLSPLTSLDLLFN